MMVNQESEQFFDGLTMTAICLDTVPTPESPVEIDLESAAARFLRFISG